MNATGVTAGPAESNGRLLLSKWRDSLHVICGLTACTPGSAPGPTLSNEYGKTLLYLTAGFMTHIICRLTAKIRDKLRNPTLRNRVWATFTCTPLFIYLSQHLSVYTSTTLLFFNLSHPLFLQHFHRSLTRCPLAAKCSQRCVDKMLLFFLFLTILSNHLSECLPDKSLFNLYGW